MLQILKYIISDSHSYKACHAPKDKPLCCSAMAGKHRLTVPRHAFRLLWRLQRSFGLKCMADCHCLPFRIRCALNKLSPGALATETCLPESIFVSPEGDFRQPLTQKHSAGRLLVIACKRDTQNHLGTRLLGISGFLGCCNLFAASLLLGLLSPAVSKLGAWAWVSKPRWFPNWGLGRVAPRRFPNWVSKLRAAWLGLGLRGGAWAW